MRILRQPSVIQVTIDQEQQQNMKYYIYLVSMLENGAGCKREDKTRISMAKPALNKNQTLFTSKMDINLSKRLRKSYI
jgi:hypothetical protein